MSRPTSPTPTDWELVLLNILWDEGPLSVDDVRETLRTRDIKRSESAIRTVLQAMVDKGLVKGKAEGRTTFYSAALPRQRVEKKVMRHLIDTVFGGNEIGFLFRALDESKVTTDVVEEMKTMLKKAKDGHESD